MIKTKNKNLWQIALQSSYTGVSLSLFNHEECIETIEYQDKRASTFLVTYLNTLLSSQRLTLSDISSIAVDKGPGAFTSLRVTIATVNGIALARKIPLIGIDGLDALAHEVKEQLNQDELSSSDRILILLNAYNNDCYYLLYRINNNQEIISLDKGCKNINAILENIENNSIYTTTLIAGNAVSQHKETIFEKLKNHCTLIENSPSVASSRIIGKLAYHQQHNATLRIIPNYMKMQSFAMKK